MNALKYLTVTTLKNRIKQLKENPLKLVMVILFVIMILSPLISLFFMNGEDIDTGSFRPVAELQTIILALYTVMFLLTSINGLSTGGSFYSMADVNLLFSAPIRQQKILFYGLLRQLGTSLLLGLFILYQYAWLHNTYNVSAGGLIAILLGYCLTVFCGQLTSMVIYAFTSGNEKRHRMVKTILYLLALAAVAAVAIPVLSSWNAADWPLKEYYKDARMGTAINTAGSWALSLFPVAGWLRAAVSGILTGSLLHLLLGLGGTIIYVILLVTLIIKMDSDFYEDVLKATEVSFSAITAKKEGKVAEAIPANVKVGKTGIGGGRGADAFYYKHKLEDRRSRVFLFDTTTLIFTAVAIAFAFFMRGEGIIVVFVCATSMQTVSIVTGRWLREMTLPYVYMVPVNPFRKLIGICRESIEKAAADAVIVMLLIGWIVGAAPAEILACILARFSFAILFMAGDILFERLLGEVASKVILRSFFILFVMLLTTPGIVIGAIIGSAAGIPAAMLIISVWNIGAGTLIAFLCRDILNYAELNNR